MKILVTGHKGFIGQHLVKELQKNEENELILYDWKDEEPYKLDFPYNEIDWIIHLGAVSSTRGDLVTVLYQNLDYSIELYENAVANNCHFQFASSAGIYGVNENHQKFHESSTPPDPRTPYAWSKFLFERYVNSHQGNSNIHTQIFRYFNVFGPEFEDHKEGQASPFYTFSKQKDELGRIKLFYGSDEIRRDFIHVSKIVEWHNTFLMIPESGVWNFGSGTAHSFLEIAKSFDCPIEYIGFPKDLIGKYQFYTCADTTELNLALETRSE